MPYYDPGYFAGRDSTRVAVASTRSIDDRLMAWELGEEYYDGERSVGYGGYRYQPERWHSIVRKVFLDFELGHSPSILDLGCKKGFFLQAIDEVFPGCILSGIENHPYPLTTASSSIRDKLRLGRYDDLGEFQDGAIDFVWAFSSIYMQNLGGVVNTLREIQRVSAGSSLVTVGAYGNAREKEIFERWTLLGTTILSSEEWIKVFEYAGYTGGWFFTTPEVLGLE